MKYSNVIHFHQLTNMVVFEQVPLASASLAQVHKAKLRSTGEIVAVKVQHKWIKEQVPGDLNLI